MARTSFLNVKQITSKQISLIAAFLISFPTSVFVGLYFENILVATILFVGTFILNFIILKWLLNIFFLRRIKLIYKLISSTKASNKEKFYYKSLLPSKNLREVSEDVVAWMETKNKEIDFLKKNDLFRKEFLQNVSHELKTPVFAIQGYVDSLLGGAVKDPIRSEKFLNSASNNIERLVRLLEDLDQITRLETGSVKLQLDAFDINAAIKSVFDSLWVLANEKNIKLQIKKGCDYSMQVVADKSKIKQVLSNLILNAIKYGKNGGIVEASIYKAENGKILIEITDNGVGIAPQHLPRVFERFYRADEARAADKGGRGLGLAICKHIIENHNEAIHVRSTKDVGTSFGFTLPAK